MALLKWKGRAWAWSPEGYVEDTQMYQGQRVEFLTPRMAMDVIRAGYAPMVHGSLSQA